MTETLPLGWEQLALAASLIVLNGLLSLWLGLGLGRKLFVASLRTVVQLTLMGWLLVPIFAAKQWWMVGLLVVFMIALSAREAIRRVSRRYKGIYLNSLLAMSVGAGTSAIFGTAVVIHADPWWTPQYFIPLVGMILGNALTGVSLGLDKMLASLDEGRDRIEAKLSLGANAWEASRGEAAEAIRTGMIPILNAMSAVGLVTIPGMMTGQILGGTPPVLAARYQIMIMFLIAGAVALGVGIAGLGTVRAMFDPLDRLKRPS